jgi:HlyD family secretion protein
MSDNGMRRSVRLWLRLALAGGVVALAWLGMRPRPVEVDAATVTRGPFELTVEEDGETRIRDPYLISAPLSGRLERVELEPGDPISEGQVIASIDPGEPGLLDARTEAESEARVRVFEAAHRRALTQVEKARAEETKAKRYYERDKVRQEKGEIALPMLEDAEHLLRVAQNDVSSAESAVDIAQFELDQARAALLHSRNLRTEGNDATRQFEIRSPIDGVVLRKFQESSTVIVAAGPILEIGDPDDLEIRIDVLSEDAVKIRPGNRVRLEHWGGPQPLEALVRRVEPSAFTKISALGVDEQRVWVYADFSPGGTPPAIVGDKRPRGEQLLGDGYRVEAEIIVSREESVLKIPSGALFRDRSAGGWCVYRVVGGKAVPTPVERGQDNGIETSLGGGLGEGETVILHPGDRVRPGVPVRIREP